MEDLQKIFDNAKQLYSITEIDEALERLADLLTKQ